MDYTKYIKLGNIEIQPITIRVSGVEITELIDEMVLDRGNIVTYEYEGDDFECYDIPMGYYSNRYGAPECVMSIGYSYDNRDNLLVDLDLGEDYDCLEGKCIEVYDWLTSDRFIKY